MGVREIDRSLEQWQMEVKDAAGADGVDAPGPSAAVHQLAGEPVAKGQGGGVHDADGAAGPVRVLGVSLLILTIRRRG